MTGLGERIAPSQLGTGFRWLWSAAIASNIADGILLAAAPLLIASLTSDPFPVAVSVFLQRVPWLLFGVLAGAAVDRFDRRRLAVVVGMLRAVIVGGLLAAMGLDALSITIIYVVAFLLGTAETLADNASSALVADTVPRSGLGLANARLIGSMMVTNQLAGPPIGAVLFGVGRAVPFGVYVVSMAASAVLLSRLRSTRVAPPAHSRPALRREIAEGMVWLWRHAPIRTLAITIALFNLTWGASIAVYVLYAKERLGIGDLGFGLLLAAGAVGGVVGATSYGALERRFSLATLMRAVLVIETLTHLVHALAPTAAVAGLAMFAFGAEAAVWGTTSTTVRQRAVPSRLLGRVGSVYMLAVFGPLAVGTLLGGVIASVWGLTAPFWFAFVGSAAALAVLWPHFPLIAHSAEVGEEMA